MMGIFGRLFGSEDEEVRDDSATDAAYEEETEICGVCGAVGDRSDLYDIDGFQIDGRPDPVNVVCHDCYVENDLDSGYPSYCCGMIYEDGEEYCASCGDPL
ncbi:hypothetical protein [Corynebacterium sp. UMB4614]|uniref:hypothetical protein n=1 Tax=Corynebacterium sp. UMB4614 TaxID=3046334 RepID=UPI00254FC313|nr:hypothetical protein [Corynebacterium sp. UMB4614]MDK7134354.1 hypothetical protein [Corynebacterium sp. UMB4614]